MAISYCFSTNGCQVSGSAGPQFEHNQKIQPAQVQEGAPIHLTRALYLPIHDHNTSHLPIYDISKQYFRTLGPFQLGGRTYQIEFCLLLKPCGYHPEDDTRYLVDMDSSGIPASIRERCMGRDVFDGTMQVLCSERTRNFAHSSRSSSPQTKGFSLSVQSPVAHTGVGARLSDTKPAQPTKRGSTCCPSLELNLEASGCKDPMAYRSLKWQLHMNNPLRYDLIDLEQNSAGDENDSVVAIYHHCGFHKDLHGPFSQGVVLLPGVEDPVLDITTVSSLLYLLHAVRKQDMSMKKSRAKSILRKLVP